MELGDVRMVQPRQYLPLMAKVAQQIVLPPPLDEFHGDGTTQHRITGQINLAHAADPQQRSNDAIPQTVAGPQRARRCVREQLRADAEDRFR